MARDINFKALCDVPVAFSPNARRKWTLHGFILSYGICDTEPFQEKAAGNAFDGEWLYCGFVNGNDAQKPEPFSKQVDRDWKEVSCEHTSWWSSRAKATQSLWFVIASVALSPASAIGCECSEVPQPKAFQHADVVFRGRVTQINHLRFVPAGASLRIEPEFNPPAVNDHTLVSFDVIRYWKGNIKRTAKVYATARPSMCDGDRFEQGKEYVIYTHRMEPRWDAQDKLLQPATLYAIADCPLRVVRDDIRREIRLLGGGRSPARD